MVVMRNKILVLFLIIIILCFSIGNNVNANMINNELEFEDMEDDSQRAIFSNLELYVLLCLMLDCVFTGATLPSATVTSMKNWGRSVDRSC